MGAGHVEFSLEPASNQRLNTGGATRVGDLAVVNHVVQRDQQQRLTVCRHNLLKARRDVAWHAVQAFVADFLEHSMAVIQHDALGALPKLRAPTQISFGSADVVTSTRFVEPFLSALPHAELEIFDGCSHATFFEDVERFHSRTLEFLRRSCAGG